jgi:hypothetical protein
VATGLEVAETLAPRENNGFTILDVTRDRIEVRQYGWKMGKPEEEIDTLEPLHRFAVQR